jgi:hypothetical protein
MKKIIACLLLLFFVSAGIVKGQIPADSIPVNLEKLFGRLRSVSEDSIRLRINDSINVLIEDHIASGLVFRRTFRNLRYLGQITSSDSLIKIITWNLVLTNQPGRYFCYLIRRSVDGNANKIYRMEKIYNDKLISADAIYSRSDWYGALYYDIRPFISASKQCWILLGINYSNLHMTRKVIDVLSFTPADSIVFGRKWFNSGGSVNYRHVLEYSSGAVISVRFRPDKSVIFDHLVPLPPSPGDDRIYFGPDYSYDAFIFRNGLWNLTINVDARNNKK